jgi:hypothetical protein
MFDEDYSLNCIQKIISEKYAWHKSEKGAHIRRVVAKLLDIGFGPAL